ncbi:MAG: HmuY family protein, partial [Myxococcales bacterium]|nr:HmuY family protein [Myxococcales bacterium]
MSPQVNPTSDALFRVRRRRLEATGTTTMRPDPPLAILVACMLVFAGCASDLKTEDNGDGSAVIEGLTTTGDDVRMTVVNASDHDAWIHLDLDRSRQADPENDGWDLAFSRFKIKSNGGVSGNGSVAATELEGQSFDELEEAPEADYVRDAEDSDDEDEDPDYALAGWYAYDPSDHSVSPKEIVYVIRSTEGDFFKLEMTDYYDEAGTSGFPAFRWAAVAPPDSEIDVQDAQPADPVGDNGGNDQDSEA